MHSSCGKRQCSGKTPHIASFAFKLRLIQAYRRSTWSRPLESPPAPVDLSNTEAYPVSSLLVRSPVSASRCFGSSASTTAHASRSRAATLASDATTEGCQLTWKSSNTAALNALSQSSRRRLSSATLGTSEYRSKCAASSFAASSRLALSSYARFDANRSSWSTAFTSMLKRRKLVIVLVKCFLAKSSFLTSAQISRTVASLLSAFRLMSATLCSSDPMALCACARSAFARAPPVLCDRTAARISSSTRRTRSRSFCTSGSTPASEDSSGKRRFRNATGSNSGDANADTSFPSPEPEPEGGDSSCTACAAPEAGARSSSIAREFWYETSREIVPSVFRRHFIPRVRMSSKSRS